MVFAPRRFGKSSLVWRAMQQLAPAGVLVAQVDLMAAPTKRQLAEKLADSIFENIASPLERVRERALAPFRDLQVQPRVTVNPSDGTFNFSFGVSHRATELDSTLERLLELPAELGAAKKHRTALVLDEFQEIVEIDAALPRLLRSVLQRQPEVSHVYLGSRRHIMERIFSDENEPFWRSAKAIELHPIPHEQFAPFIRKRFRAGRKSVPAAVVEAVLDRTNGHPYATQELCYFLWEETPPETGAAEQELEAALAALLRSEHAHFGLLWENASTGQKLVLQALAREPGRPFSAAYRRLHNLPPATNVQRALRALTERELVRSDRGAYSISEPFLADWIEAQVGG